MDGNVIKQFLIGLGFGVDEGDLARFNKAISSATLKVAGLYTAVKLSAAGIFFGISKISEGFEELGHEFRIIAPTINKTLQLRQAMLSAFHAAGINITQAVKQSVLFNFSLAKTKFALEAIYKSVGIRFIPLLTKQMDIFRKQIYDNMPKIQNALAKFIKLIFTAFEATTILGGRLWSILGRVYEFFKKLDAATNGWSTIILGVVAAWKLLNLSFLATPLGLLITGLTTLLALWDDFKTFKEGGESLINWGSDATKMVVGLTTAILALSAAVASILAIYTLWTNATKIQAAAQAGLNILLAANPIGVIIIAVTALLGLLTALDAKWKLFGGHVSGFFSSVGGKVLDFLGGTSDAGSNTGGKVVDFMKGAPNAGANVSGANNPATSPLANPVGSNIQNNSSKQNISQETNIVVQGSADANSTGKAIATQQNQVNFNMARNLKGATR